MGGKRKGKNDEHTRAWVTDWLNQQDWCVTATTFDNEDGGADITYTTSAGTFNCELKSQRKNHDEAWDVYNQNISFCNVPKKSDTNDTFENKFRFEDRFNGVSGATIPDKFYDKKFFIINSDNSNGDFMKEHANSNYDCKWLKMLKGKQTLIILYKDGLYIIDNQELRKKFLGYVRYGETEWTNKTGYYKTEGNQYRYGIKAAIELSDDDFLYMGDIPQDLFRKN